MFFAELAAKPWQFRAQDAVSAEFKEQLEELDENCTEGCSVQKHLTWQRAVKLGEGAEHWGNN